MKLSAIQVEIIRARIARSICMPPTLADDLVDHVCCVLEQREDTEVEFEEAVNEAIQEVAPHGLLALERDTLLLLHAKSIVMKKIVYSVGLITAITSCMGITFKLLHLNGANFLLTWGLLAFTLIFLPAQMLLTWRAQTPTALREKLKVLFALTSGLLTGVAIVLRLFHISNNHVDMLFVASTAIFCFGFLPIQFFSFYKKAMA